MRNSLVFPSVYVFKVVSEILRSQYLQYYDRVMLSFKTINLSLDTRDIKTWHKSIHRRKINNWTFFQGPFLPIPGLCGPLMLRVSLCRGHALRQRSACRRLRTSGTHYRMTFVTPLRCQPVNATCRTENALFYCCVLMMSIPFAPLY